jgi:hypothetical protein
MGGWAQQLLEWRWRGVWLEAEISARRRKAEKGRELGGANYRPRDIAVETRAVRDIPDRQQPRDPVEALDAALAAFAGVIEDCD